MPYLILWLIHTAPDESCNDRKACAKDILEYPGDDDFTLKFRACFASESVSYTHLTLPTICSV
eukprot:3872490-Alexandrium_andersonii.AAC.1